MLTTYSKLARIDTAPPYLVPQARHLEPVLDRQRRFIGFHWDKAANAYRQQEEEIAARVSADSTGDEERVASANAIIAALDRYKATYLPKLQAVSADVDQAMARCASFVRLVSTPQHPEAARWYELTQQLVAARRAAVGNGDGSGWQAAAHCERKGDNPIQRVCRTRRGAARIVR